jgi:hypothetical protein
MDRRRLERALDGVDVIYAACGLSLAIGLFFIFAWAPHPWGHEGFDHYHQLALTLAAGGAFPTMDVPWGYAYVLAAFYRVFGDHPPIPLVVQATLNAAMPLLVYTAGRAWFDRRTAAIAALITGAASFNTVYASTQSSDAVCTVMFMCAVLAFLASQRRDDLRWSALAGALAGLASQFRPNLVLVPLLLAGYLAVFARRRRWPLHAAAVVGCAALTLAPWVVRNYRLTHMLVPTSLHSGVQLWYGTLQVGPYLNSRAYNPRTIFESPVFEYTSLDRVPLIVTAARRNCGTPEPLRPTLVYWSDRDATPRTAPGRFDHDAVTFEAPAPPAPAVLYYYLTADWTRSGGTATATTTPHGGAPPLVFFVNRDHLGDLDVHGDLVDSFDLIRLMRHLAWNEPLPFADRLAAAGIGDRDIGALVAVLQRRFEVRADAAPAALAHDDREARLTFADGSTLIVPRQWQGLITDVAFQGALAAGVMSSTERVEALRRPDNRGPAAAGGDPCAVFEQVAVNTVFYRREPHLMARYTALAFDNIRRTPWQFAGASAYRMLRLFVIHGDDDPRTSQQFTHGGRVYAAATVASAVFAALLVCGAIIAWRQGAAIALPLLLILYVPFTIAPMLTNMRYTVTVQPLAFLFVAVSLNALLQRAGLLPARPAAPAPAGR